MSKIYEQTVRDIGAAWQTVGLELKAVTDPHARRRLDREEAARMSQMKERLRKAAGVFTFPSLLG